MRGRKKRYPPEKRLMILKYKGGKKLKRAQQKEKNTN